MFGTFEMENEKKMKTKKCQNESKQQINENPFGDEKNTAKNLQWGKICLIRLNRKHLLMLQCL